MKPTWIVQSNLGKSGDVDEIARTCVRLGVGFLPVKAIPFDPNPPEIYLPGPVCFYGATNFVAVANRAGRWQPGAFFDDYLFTFPVWNTHYECLNSDGEVTTIGEFAERELDPDDEFFIRPVRDLKEFAGNVVRFGDFAEWYKRISHNEYTVKTDCPIMVAAPKRISAEWRLFLVDGEVVSGSRYKKDGRLDISPDFPAAVKAYAEAAARAWQPAPVFVLDVCAAGDLLRVVEIGCFNSAGFYAADIGTIVEAVTGHMETCYEI